MTRVLVVDDSSQFRGVACAWIALQSGLEVAGEAADGLAAVAAVEKMRPDLVLMDALMPGMDGFEATRRIKAASDAPPIVILTLHDSAATRSAAETAGADGFVAKSNLTQELPRVLETLLEMPG